MASPTAAANAYASLSRMMETAAGAGRTSSASSSDPSGASFGALLKDTLNSVMESGRKSDVQTVAMAKGKANVMDVVTAVAETDVAVSTLVSVRDKVIQAYEDIMKMPI
ncbi:flagellar hook-basal body complex protein FliE [Bradyrhizobium sp. WD16]|uniref:flagellar hook-basal body complex protein FliE n=1 Tax=Bradyrhizobium sp. WD16 TaxID=1521768 RepID=UPI0020A2F93C|nr:flagellar hook-basal body complex protein FliE [Bradyrhizobium sp. WD16]UTD28504.1 flagellar hook-basal body complex protein FliE [Bradyrhizobium sp. WD16]